MHDVALSAEEVASKEFPVSFRGFDQHEVRAFLAQVAAELAAARERERLQRDRLEAAEARAASQVPSDDEIEAALGHEAGRVLHAAREAAREIRARAEEQVARLVRDASGEGSRAEQEAEALLARRTEEAERVAAEITAEAHRFAEAELDRAKTEGRQMVGEAQAVRERVLKDLARRRKTAHQQLEQLRAGRERLLEAYRIVRATLDEATSELSVAEAEARAAAETAALRVGAQPEATVEELEAELLSARDLGLGPVAGASRPPGAAEEHPQVNGNGIHRPPPTAERSAVAAPDETAPPLVMADPPPEETTVAVSAPEGPPPEVVPPPLAPEPVENVIPVEESESEPPDRGDVDALFARLRAEESTSGDEAPPAPSPSEPTVPVATVDDEELLQRRDVELEPVERTLVKSLKRTLADEQNEVLDTLRRSHSSSSLAELLPGASDHTARYLAIVDPVLATAARLGAGSDDGAPPVSDLAVGLAAAVVEDLRARLQRVLEAADGDEAMLTEGISSAYREWKTSRVEPLARHSSAAAHTRGRFATAPKGPLRWVVDADEGPCPDCDDNALAVTAKGEAFPTGQRHPPAHFGCRCTIAAE